MYKENVKLNVREVSETMGIWGTMCIMIVNEKLLSDEYLAKIGQPTTPI